MVTMRLMQDRPMEADIFSFPVFQLDAFRLSHCTVKQDSSFPGCFRLRLSLIQLNIASIMAFVLKRIIDGKVKNFHI